MPNGLTVSDLHFLDWGPLGFSIGGRECVGLRGASGSGKSLLLRALADLDEHTGEVALGGVRCDTLPAPEWRRQVGMLPAESSWWRETVGEHFTEIDDEAENLVGRLGFRSPEVFGWEVTRLSVGERQRLSLARLLHRRPRALLLDEPTANLDEASAGCVEQLIREYRSEGLVPVLWVSHSPEQLARVADREFIFEEKKLIEIRTS